MASHNEQHKAFLDELLLVIPGVSARKTFGAPAYYIEGKMFACVHGEGVVLKLPAETLTDVFKRDDVVTFDPGGQGVVMGGWVKINRKDSTGYGEDEALFHEAIEYVAELASTPPKKKLKAK
jgi:hypothetical protein